MTFSGGAESSPQLPPAFLQIVPLRLPTALPVPRAPYALLRLELIPSGNVHTASS